MPKAKPAPERSIRELEDALKAAERRIEELRAERDEASELVERMRQHLADSDILIESWIEAFDMQLRDDGRYRFEDGTGEKYDSMLDKYNALVKRWNKLVQHCYPQSPGRPLNASEAQCAEVMKLHKRKVSLRDIADETSLSLRTVRTITERDHRTDRATIKRYEKIDPMNAALREAKSRKRIRDALPDRINHLIAENAALQTEARGLGKK